MHYYTYASVINVLAPMSLSFKIDFMLKQTFCPRRVQIFVDLARGFDCTANQARKT